MKKYQIKFEVKWNESLKWGRREFESAANIRSSSYISPKEVQEGGISIEFIRSLSTTFLYRDSL